MASAESEKNHDPEYGLAAIWQEAENVSYLNRSGIGRQIFSDALRSFSLSPITTAFSFLSICAALFLFGVFLLVFQNTYNILSSSASEYAISIYLKDGLDKKKLDQSFEGLVSLPEVAEVQFWDKDKALTEFQTAFSEFPQIMSGLSEGNPLPASFEVRLKPGVSYGRYKALVEDFKESFGVLHVGYEHELIEQLEGLVGFVKRTGGFAVVVILIITGFVIASTIRLALFLRQDELSIMRLVGAHSWLIRAPCLLEGFIYGFLGGVLSLILLAAFLSALKTSMADVAILSSAVEQIHYLSFFRSLMLIAVGVLVGMAASFFASHKAASE